MTKYLEIGQIVNTFGIKGMVKIKLFSDDIERFNNLKKYMLKTEMILKNMKSEEIKYHKGMVLIKFKGIENPEDAEFIAQQLFISR